MTRTTWCLLLAVVALPEAMGGTALADATVPEPTVTPATTPEPESPLALEVRYLGRVPGTATRRFRVTLSNRGRKTLKLVFASADGLSAFKFFFDEPVEGLTFSPPPGPPVRKLAAGKSLTWVVKKGFPTAYHLSAYYDAEEGNLSACPDCFRGAAHSKEIAEYLPEFRPPEDR